MATPDDERLDPRRGVDPLSYTDHAARYEFAAGVAYGRVWDAACGIGYGASILAENKTGMVTSIYACDIDADAIAYAKSRYANVLTTFDVCDVESPLSHQPVFDTVVAFEMIEHLLRPTQFLSGVAGRLEPRGLLIVSTPDRSLNPEGVERRTKFHHQEFSADEFRSLLGTVFDNVELFTQDVFPSTRIRWMDRGNRALDTTPLRATPVGRRYTRQPWSVLIAVCSNSTLLRAGLENMGGYYIGDGAPLDP